MVISPIFNSHTFRRISRTPLPLTVPEGSCVIYCRSFATTLNALLDLGQGGGNPISKPLARLRSGHISQERAFLKVRVQRTPRIFFDG
jgi:hypothetical protein